MSKYLTFPMVIFKDANKDIKQAANNAIFYCLYDYCKGKEGTQADLIKEAEAHFGLSYGSKKTSYDTGKILFNSIPSNSPKTSILKATVFDFCLNSKTDFEIITFIAFAAIRSILQQQAYTKITNEYLIGRMAGNSKAGEPIPDGLCKYNNRYQLDKIKQDLQFHWGLKLYGHHTRGFYVSFSMDINQLVIKAELRRKIYKVKKLQETKEAARQAALIAINCNKFQ